MITLALSALLGAVIIATGLTFIDCWIRGRYMFESLREERALLDAGFVPMEQGAQHRVRQPVRFETLATPARVSNRLPVHRLAANRSHPQRSAPGAA